MVSAKSPESERQAQQRAQRTSDLDTGIDEVRSSDGNSYEMFDLNKTLPGLP